MITTLETFLMPSTRLFKFGGMRRLVTKFVKPKLKRHLQVEAMKCREYSKDLEDKTSYHII